LPRMKRFASAGTLALSPLPFFFLLIAYPVSFSTPHRTSFFSVGSRLS
jgi:hypothetical protein